MTSYTLRVPIPIRDEIESHAAEDRNETCGLLGGKLNDGIALVDCHFPLINEHPCPTRYHAEPRSLLAAFKALRVAGRELLAIWHSHPGAPPVPSRIDLEEWHYHDVIMVILGEGVWRGWWVSKEEYHEAALLFTAI